VRHVSLSKVELALFHLSHSFKNFSFVWKSHSLLGAFFVLNRAIKDKNNLRLQTIPLIPSINISMEDLAELFLTKTAQVTGNLTIIGLKLTRIWKLQIDLKI